MGFGGKLGATGRLPTGAPVLLRVPERAEEAEMGSAVRQRETKLLTIRALCGCVGLSRVGVVDDKRNFSDGGDTASSH